MVEINVGPEQAERFGMAQSGHCYQSEQAVICPSPKGAGRRQRQCCCQKRLNLDLATTELKPLAEKVWAYCEAKGFSGKTVTVKVKYSDFTQATRSRTAALPFANGNEILEAATGLLATVYPFKRSVRLLGVTLSSLTNERRDVDGSLEPQLDFSL